MTNDNRHQAGAPASQGGQFKAEQKPAGDTVLIGEHSQWRNGGQGHGVIIIESPVSDREHNYYLTFDADGWISVNPFEFGIGDPDYSPGEELDRLFIGMNDTGDGLQVQFSAAIDPAYFEEVLDHLDDQELADLEAAVLTRVRTAVGDDTVTMEFTTSKERWGDVHINVNSTIDSNIPVMTVDQDGRFTVTTSNLMHWLENDSAYVQAVNGAGTAAVFQVLAEHGITF